MNASDSDQRRVRVFHVCFLRIHAQIVVGHNVKVETALLFVSSSSNVPNL